MFSLAKIVSETKIINGLQKPKFGFIVTSGGDENSSLNITI